MSLDQVKSYVFDPLLVSEESIKNYLLSQKPGTGQVFDQKLIIYLGQNNFTEVDISLVDPNKFLSFVSFDQAQEIAQQNMTRFLDIKSFKNFETQILSPGDLGEIVTDSNAIFSCVVSKKTDGNYFDFVIYIVKNNRVIGNINYSTKVLSGLCHSGDVGSLLHWVKINFLQIDNNCYLVLCVNGYPNKKELYSFQDQHPAIYLINNQSETISVIPCPLDRATVGTASFAGLAVIKFDKSQRTQKYFVLQQLLTLTGINTGDNSPEVHNKVLLAVNQAKDHFERVRSNSHNKIPKSSVLNQPNPDPKLKEREDKTFKLNENKLDYLKTKDILTFVEGGIDMSLDDEYLGKSILCHFSTGLHLHFSDSDYESYSQSFVSKVNLPIIGGLCQDVAALALGTPCNISFQDSEQYEQFLSNKKLIIVHISTERWLDTVSKSGTKTVNGLFIIHGPYKLFDESKMELVEEYLNNLNRNALLMAGPNSLVLVQLPSGKRVFYRGVTWKGFLDYFPKFGQLVDLSDTKILELLESRSKSLNDDPLFLGPTIRAKTNMKVIFQGNLVDYKNVNKAIQDCTYQQLIDQSEDLINALNQISCLLSPEEMKTFNSNLNHTVNSTLIKEEKVIKDQMNILIEEMITNKDDIEKTKKQYEQLIHQKKLIRRNIQPLIDALSSMVSQKGASNRKSDLNRMIRKETIQGNVKKTNDMTRAEIGNYLSEVCEDYGCVIVSISEDTLFKLIPLIPQVNKFNQFLSTNLEMVIDLTEVNSRCPMLDSSTMPCLIESGGTQGDHPLNGSATLAFCSQGQSLIPIPLLKKYVKAKSIGSFTWMEECDLPEVSIYRILMRSMICRATTCRQFNISPGSKDLTLFLIYLLLNLIHSIIKKMTTIPTIDQWDDTNCQIIRGLYGQLLSLMASGTNPQCLAFQMVYHNPKLEIPKENEWWAWTLLVTAFPYTLWPQDNIVNNVKLLLVRTLRKLVVDPLTEKLRQNMTQIKKENQKNHIDLRNLELKWLYLAVEVTLKIDEDKLYLQSFDFKEISLRLLSFLPADLNMKEGTSMIVKFYKDIVSLNMSNLKATQKVSYVENFKKIVQVAIDIKFKRGAVFRWLKECLLKSLQSQGKNVDQLINQLDKYQQNIKDQHDSIQYLKIQNHQAVLNQDVGRIKGDAELKGDPYSITNEPFDKIFMYKDVQFIITGVKPELDGDSSSQVSLITKDIAEEKAVIKAFKTLPEASKALILANKLDSLDLTDLKPYNYPINYYQVLMEFLGVKTSDINQITAQILEIFLLGWKNTFEAETPAIEVLNNYFQKDSLTHSSYEVELD